MFKKGIKTGHSLINNLIALDDIKFGKHGYARGNIMHSLITQNLQKQKAEDIMHMEIGGRFGSNKNWGVSVGGGKGHGKIELSRTF